MKVLALLLGVIVPWFGWVVLAVPVDNDLVLKPQPGRTVEKQVCGITGGTDFIVVLDGSSSIKSNNFKILTDWLARIVERLPDSARYGVVQFAGHPVKMWDLAAYENRTAAAKAFRTMRYITGTTKLGLALEFTIEEKYFDPSTGNRPEVPDIVVIITDGRSSDDPVPVANRIRQFPGVQQFLVIGITDQIDRQQLNALVDGDENYEGEDKFTYIEKFTFLSDSVINSLISKTQECRTELVSEPDGAPSIDLMCKPDGIYVGADTRNPFEGRVYVKGQATDPACVNAGDGTTSRAEINLDLNGCGTVRRRSAEPPGIFIENTVVFSFHPKFLTKVDRVYSVQCFFMEADKTVSQRLGIERELTTSLVTQTFQMPTCQYTLHRDSPDGPVVKFAIVGEKIFHRWECDNSNSEDLFKMRVHSCYVENNGNKVQLLDETGCAIDKYLLNNLNYQDDRMLAFVEAHAFKFPDQSSQYFQCQIELCVNLEDGCQNTPPTCGDTPGGTARILEAGPEQGQDQAAPSNGRQRRQVPVVYLGSEPYEPMSIDVVSQHLQLAEWFSLPLNSSSDIEPVIQRSIEQQKLLQLEAIEHRAQNDSDICIKHWTLPLTGGVMAMFTLVGSVLISMRMRRTRV